MAAALFFLPYQVATVNAIAQPRATLTFYQTGTTTKLPIYTTSLLSVQLANPVTASGGGRFPDIYLDDTQTYRMVVKDRLGTVLDDIDPYVPGTVSGLTLAAGAVVTPQDYASGLPLPLGGGIQDDSSAFVAAIAYLKSIAVNNDGNLYKGSQKLFVPAGLYNMGTTTLDITHTLIIEGEGSINGYNSRLSWSGDTTGIRVQAYNTSGSATVDGPHFSGSYTTIRGLGLVGPYVNSSNFTGHTEGEYHAINARSNVVIEDCLIDGWAGDGVHAQTSSGGGGADEGNSNCSFINRIKVTNVRNGVFIDGSDANAWTCIGIIGFYCRRWTVWDSSFLGNTHIGHHSANAALIRGVSPTVVSYSGNRYAVVAGQSTGAATNAPSGTTADNTWWLYIGVGAADATLNIPAWANPTTVREGGCYYTDNANNYATFIGCYNEGGEGPAQFLHQTCVIGGLWGTRNPLTTGNWYAGHRCDVTYVKLVPGTVPGILEDGQVWYDLATNKLKARISAATVDIPFSGSASTPSSILCSGAIASSSATAGIGYSTGSGGTVTQITSRTTGVTLNKVCGAITLFSAAGSATYQTFTVTNSTVAATDTVRVVQKSGTDKNMIHVTAVGAGSFDITFATTGGTTTEQPVFNFSVLKSVAA